MEGSKEAQRITVYLNETDTWHGQNLAAVIVEKARRSGLVGMLMLSDVFGFLHRQGAYENEDKV